LRRRDLTEEEVVELMEKDEKLYAAYLSDAYERIDELPIRLDEADFKGAILNGAKLEGADLSAVRNLTQEQVDSAVINNKTRLPEKLK